MRKKKGTFSGLKKSVGKLRKTVNGLGKSFGMKSKKGQKLQKLFIIRPNSKMSPKPKRKRRLY